MRTYSRGTRFVVGGAVTGAMLLPVGALGSRFGVWPFTVGFLMLAVGVLLALIAFGLGIVVLVRAVRQGRRSDYPALAFGGVLSIAVLGIVGGQFTAASSVPPIHNVSTDLDDPPTFQQVVALREGANPHAFDRRQPVGELGPLGEVQRSAFPDVRTLETSIGVQAGVERAVQVLETMGLDIVHADPSAGIVEATATTFWFGFKDDVVVRIRPHEGGSHVDVHSVSRVGQSDLGANAARILTFLERFAGE